MPNAAVVAAALTDHSVRTYGLWVGGVDWLKQPGAAGNAYGVPIDTIEVIEAGPGGVSSLRCTLEDPAASIPIPSAGNEVSLWDIAHDHPEFAGFVQAVDVRPMQPTGRYLDLTAIGIEILLDWSIVQSEVLSAGDLTGPAWQQAAATVPIRAFLQPAGPGQGNQAGPIAATRSAYNVNALTITASTLREAIRQIWSANTVGPLVSAVVNTTIDFTRGLRIWPSTISVSPDDYATLTVDDTAHTNGSQDLHYTLTPADVVRQVTVIGTGYSGTFGDGSGIVGIEAVLNDSTVTNATQGAAAAAAYLEQFTPMLRGTLHLTTFSHGSTNYRAGSYLTLTDALLGLAATSVLIGSITKRYNSNGSEEWDIAFGGLAPSLSNSVRRLTRSTLS